MTLNKSCWFLAARLLPTILVLCAAPTSQLIAQDVDLGQVPAEVVRARMANRMARHVNFAGFDDPSLTFRDAQLSLGDMYFLSFDIKDRPFERESCSADELLKRRVAQTPIPAMRDVPVAAVVRAVLARAVPPLGATYLFRTYEIEITTPRQALKEARDRLGDGLMQYLGNLAECDWKQFDQYGIDTMRFLGEMNYWNGVMNENTKALLAAEPQTRNVP